MGDMECLGYEEDSQTRRFALNASGGRRGGHYRSARWSGTGQGRRGAAGSRAAQTKMTVWTVPVDKDLDKVN